jgi:hypothetical protein
VTLHAAWTKFLADVASKHQFSEEEISFCKRLFYAGAFAVYAASSRRRIPANMIAEMKTARDAIASGNDF